VARHRTKDRQGNQMQTNQPNLRSRVGRRGQTNLIRCTGDDTDAILLISLLIGT
jgi:hypothetical protein